MFKNIFSIHVFIFIFSIIYSQTTFREISVTNGADGLFSVIIEDVDKDGDLDIISASYLDDKIAWYENDGNIIPTFSTHVVSTAANGAVLVVAGDLDNDGDIDIISACYDNNSIVWYENDGNIIPTFSSHVVSTNVNGAVSVDLGDIDSDGDIDIISAGFKDNAIYWHQNDGKPNPSFSFKVVSKTPVEVRSISIGDFNQDGNLDISSASVKEDEIAIYKNSGTLDPLFTKEIVSNNADGAYYIYSSDINGDGNEDLVSASIYDDKIAWYENDGSAIPKFTEHTISTSADAARSVHSGDLDNDGDIDIVSASYKDDKIAWYQNQFINSEILISPDTLEVKEDSSATINFLINDKIERIVNYNIMIIDASKNGNSQIISDSIMYYMPKPDFYGVDSVKYSIFAESVSDSGKILINVVNVNDAPQNFVWLTSGNDSIRINKTNLSDNYNISWTKSIDVDNDQIEYLIYSKIGNFSENLWEKTKYSSKSFSYNELLSQGFNSFPNSQSITLKLSISATDKIDTVRISGNEKHLFINRYDNLSIIENKIPLNFELYKNYPNPFNPQTKIIFGIPHEADIRITIYDILGRKMKEFNYENLNAGKHSITWNAKDDFTNNVAPGIYFCQLKSNTGYTETIKMILLK
tara:strand:- start:37269 stop:39185 length:1917 start_codon:yes stop_codon:yes gene_type:complete